MKLSELKERVDRALLRSGNEDLDVCIPNNKNVMGGTPVTQVKSTSTGIDWDSSKFFIIPEVKMIEKPE